MKRNPSRLERVFLRPVFSIVSWNQDTFEPIPGWSLYKIDSFDDSIVEGIQILL